MQKKLDDLKSQQKALMEDNSKYLETLQKKSESVGIEQPWQNDNVPKKVQDKLDELHNQHQSEIKRLETEMKNQRMSKQTSKELSKENDYSEMHDIQSSKLQQNVYEPRAHKINNTNFMLYFISCFEPGFIFCTKKLKSSQEYFSSHFRTLTKNQLVCFTS